MKIQNIDRQQVKSLNKKFFLTGIFLFVLFFSQAQVLDITIKSQYKALYDSTESSSVHDNDDIELAEKDFIQETYQIPGYSLYYKYWDTENISSQRLKIPFEGNPLSLFLVQSNNNPFFYPCDGNNSILAEYGATKKGFHPGVDIRVNQGAPLRCCFDGVVRLAKNYGDYGKVVVVRHYNGLETIYSNLSIIMVKPGQILQAGDIIGASGKAKKSGTEQMHFEVRFMNECFDPGLFIDFESMGLKDNLLVLNESDLSIQESIAAENEFKAEYEKGRIESEEQSMGTQKESSEELYHVVKTGDTMYSISKKYQLSLTDLFQLNNMKETDKIKIGQRIRVK